MTTQVRVNVTSAVDKKTIREETINGRKVMIIPSATMPAEIVMNGVKYPGDVIKASYASLDRAPAPCGHPKLAGQYLSARDPEAINHFHVGAWNSNVRWEGDRILLDKVIDVEYAGRTEQGKRLLNAIAEGKPISTSTGLIAEVDDVAEGADHEKIARGIVFDHDAILLDEEPAATPEQGVGMLVNGKAIPVHNYNLDGVMREVDWAGQEMVRSLQRAADATLWAKVRDKVMAVITEGLGLAAPKTEPATSASTEDTPMSADEIKKLNEAIDKQATLVNELATKVNETKDMPTTMAAIAKSLEDLTAKVNGMVEEKNAADKSKDEEDVVKAGLMNAEEAKKADAVVVNTLAKKAREMAAAAPAAAPILRGALHVNAADVAKVEDHFN